MLIDNKTRLNMVIGYPLEHTLSPILHNSVYKLLDVNAVLLAHASEDLRSTLQALKTLSVGYSAVTMPFKAAIIPYLDEMGQEISSLKAANTIIFQSGKLIGYNTDVDGIAYALRNTELTNKNVLLIGSGGAGHAAAYYLKEKNANIFYCNRTKKHAIFLAELFGGKFIEKNEIEKYSFDVIINTTPLGMLPHVLNSPLPDYSFTPNQTVFDMVYNPIETEFLKKARTRGAFCISGIDMFLAQGLKQIELWLKQPIQYDEFIAILKNEIKYQL